jgi:hypothetical protein
VGWGFQLFNDLKTCISRDLISGSRPVRAKIIECEANGPGFRVSSIYEPFHLMCET